MSRNIKTIILSLAAAVGCCLATGCEKYETNSANHRFVVSVSASEVTPDGDVAITFHDESGIKSDEGFTLSGTVRNPATGEEIPATLSSKSGVPLDGSVWLFDENGDFPFLIKGLNKGKWEVVFTAVRWKHSSTVVINLNLE